MTMRAPVKERAMSVIKMLTAYIENPSQNSSIFINRSTYTCSTYILRVPPPYLIFADIVVYVIDVFLL